MNETQSAQGGTGPFATVAVFKFEEGREVVVPGVWFAEEKTEPEQDVRLVALLMAGLLGAKVEWREFPIVEAQDGDEGGPLQVEFKNVTTGEVVGPMFPAPGQKVIFLAGPEQRRAMEKHLNQQDPKPSNEARAGSPWNANANAADEAAG